MRTPTAVPGTITRNTRSDGNPKTPTSNPDRMTSCVRLSRASPKKAFQSPGAYHRRSDGVTLGRTLIRGDRGRLADERSDAFRERSAPGELAPLPGDVAVQQLHRRVAGGRHERLAQP